MERRRTRRDERQDKKESVGERKRDRERVGGVGRNTDTEDEEREENMISMVVAERKGIGDVTMVSPSG